MISFDYRGRKYHIEPVSDIDHIGRVIAKRGAFYEIEMLEDMAASLKPGAVVYDIGANFGNHTIYLAGICKAWVKAFEPCAQLVMALINNLYINGLYDYVCVYPFAVGSVCGRGDSLVISDKNMGLSKFEISDQGYTRIITIDSLGEKSVDCMKIDVEGMELDVLKGAEKTIRKHKPLLYVEIIGDEDLREITQYLKSLGYERTKRFLEISTPTYKFER